MTDSPVVQALMQRRPMTAADFGMANNPDLAARYRNAMNVMPRMTGAMLGYGAAPVGVGAMPPQRRPMTAEELMGNATQPGY